MARNKVFITEGDRYLFGMGTHYEIYEKLGARLKKGSVRFLMEKESMEALAGSGNGGPSVI